MSEVESNNEIPEFIISTEGEILGKDTPENREIVRRIHACVNACQDISTEELEKGIINDMRQVLAEVIPLLQNPQENSTGVNKPHFIDNQTELKIQTQKFHT